MLAFGFGQNVAGDLCHGPAATINGRQKERLMESGNHLALTATGESHGAGTHKTLVGSRPGSH